MSLAAAYGWEVVVSGIKELPSRELTYPDISPTKALFEDDFRLPKVGYVGSLEGMPLKLGTQKFLSKES